MGVGQEPQRTGSLPDEPASREEAIEIITRYISPFHQKGFNEEQGYWWCRNVGDDATAILAIEG
jgi:hypothetical protein